MRVSARLHDSYHHPLSLHDCKASMSNSKSATRSVTVARIPADRRPDLRIALLSNTSIAVHQTPQCWQAWRQPGASHESLTAGCMLRTAHNMTGCSPDVIRGPTLTLPPPKTHLRASNIAKSPRTPNLHVQGTAGSLMSVFVCFSSSEIDSGI